MPKEKPIIPYGIPNPVGPAIFQGVRNKSRIGGNLPKERYPLVCQPAFAHNPNEVPMGTGDYKRLLEVLKPVHQQDPDPYQQRLENLKEESKKGPFINHVVSKGVQK